MKFLIIGTVLLGVAGCTTSKEKLIADHDIRLVTDITDQMALKPNAQFIVSQCGLDENIYQGINLTTGIINEYSITAEKTITLKPDESLYNNRHVRQSKVTAFIKEVQQELDTIMSDTAPKQRSAVFISVARHLTQLSKSSAKSRRMYIYSDMLEHCDTFDFYAAETLAKLKDNPKEIIEQLEEIHQLPDDLTGIAIYFMYSPISKEDNDRYDIVIATFYKTWLTSKHAIVILKASH